MEHYSAQHHKTFHFWVQKKKVDGNMAVMYWNNYVDGQKKLCRKSENMVKCNRVLSFIYDSELDYITSNVQVSM